MPPRSAAVEKKRRNIPQQHNKRHKGFHTSGGAHPDGGAERREGGGCLYAQYVCVLVDYLVRKCKN